MRDSALKPAITTFIRKDGMVGNELMRDSALKRELHTPGVHLAAVVGNELMRDSALKRDTARRTRSAARAGWK